MESKKIKEAWNWLWHSDSILSWVVSLVLAFIVVKFIFFPLLSFTLATSLPLVVVESSSMEHPSAGFMGNVIRTQNSFDSWWNNKGSWYEKKGLEKQEAESWPLRTGFDKGDIMLVSGRGKDPEVGDVIIFEANQKHPLIHRIVSVDPKTGVIETKGDNNAGQLSIEKSIAEDAVIGKAVIKVPKLGWLKLFFVETFETFSK